MNGDCRAGDGVPCRIGDEQKRSERMLRRHRWTADLRLWGATADLASLTPWTAKFEQMEVQAHADAVAWTLPPIGPAVAVVSGDGLLVGGRDRGVEGEWSCERAPSNRRCRWWRLRYR